MAPTDNVFPSKLDILETLNNLVVSDNSSDDESIVEEADSDTEDYLSSEGDYSMHYVTEDESEVEESSWTPNMETPLTSYTDGSRDQNSLIRRFVSAARRLFQSDVDENESFEMEYLSNTDDEADT